MRHSRSTTTEGLTDREELVWQLLLQHHWQEPELQIVSRLLCVSTSMAQLIHSTCEGRVKARITSSRSPTCRPQTGSKAALKQWLGPVLAESQLLGRWLARNGRLLGSLEVLVEPEAEQAITAGLQAAAAATAKGAHSSRGPSNLRTRSQARLVAAVDAAASASEPAGAQQGLLLRHLIFAGSAPSSQLLLSAGSSTLQVLVTPLPSQPAGLQQHARALATLTTLHQLFLINQPGSTSTRTRTTSSMGSISSGGTLGFSAHCAAARKLRSLQQLVLFSMEGPVLQQRDIDALPPSLLQLQAAAACTAHTPGLDFRHLTALKSLSLPWISKGLTLPPSVTLVEALGCTDLSAVLGLRDVRVLRLWVSELRPQQLQQLAGVPQHQELQLGCVFNPSDEVVLDQHAAVPQLRKLTVVDGVLGTAAADALGRMTQLTSLSLLCRRVDVPAQQLLQRLQQLTGLQQLRVLLPPVAPGQQGGGEQCRLIGALCGSTGILPYVGCEFLQPFNGLLQQQSGGSVPSGEERAAESSRFSMHCFGKQQGAAASSSNGSSSSLLGLLAHSTWHTLLKKQPPPCQPTAAAAAPLAAGVGQQQATPVVAAAPALQQQQQYAGVGSGVAAGVAGSVAC